MKREGWWLGVDMIRDGECKINVKIIGCLPLF